MSLASKSRPWSEAEKVQLTRLLLVEGKDYPVIARMLRRTQEDCIETAGSIKAPHYLKLARQGFGARARAGGGDL